ncbi:hypothetical protein TrLO_g10257 [Triparma laevis f. longispina]|uniref:Protein kinase domain-containing protein n=1 Tax=Triparma laevis f. longispina TaxID=1714387 RepID=A0A9W6ZKI5_9STRA|nr:hypothetical protein TrLO_g10257 [Triparma laevis f. longispina]
MGYNHMSKVQTEKLADADAFTTWLAEVANGELKAPVEGRDMHFRDEEIENSFIKFRWNLMLEAFKKGMLVMNVAYTLYLGTLTTLYDLMYFLVGLNAPVMMCGFIAWKCKATDNVEIIKKRKKILTVLLTFVNVVQASFGASTSDLSMCIVTVILLMCFHICVTLSFYQKFLMYTVAIFVTMLNLIGMGPMGEHTDFSRVYSEGYCMNTMECAEENFKPNELSLVCDPAYPLVEPLNASEFNVSRTDMDDLALAWFENDDISCYFVHNKWLWPYKQMFFMFIYWIALLISLKGQNRSERDGFYQIYSANKEKFKVRLALKKALEKQQFSDDQFDMIKSVLIKSGQGSNDPLFDLHIDVHKLDVGKVLGRGAQGVVLKGKYQNNEVAIKTLINVDYKELRQFRSEIALTKSLVHPNIVKLIGITVSKELLGCILEFVSQGTLEDCLDKASKATDKKLDKSKMTWPEEKYKIMEGTVRGLAFLHNADFYDDNFNKWEHCVVHRDLKPANILVTDMFVPKISDFGCSRFKKEDINMTQIGTPIYAAPEVILGQKYDEKCDIYSFAIVMCGLAFNLGNLDNTVMAEAEKQFPNKTRNATNIMKMIADGMRPSLPDDCPPAVKEIIEQCWHGEATLRPTADELLKVLQHVVRPQLINPETNNENVEKEIEDAKTIRVALRRRSQVSIRQIVPVPEVAVAGKGEGEGKERGKGEGEGVLKGERGGQKKLSDDEKKDEEVKLHTTYQPPE